MNHILIAPGGPHPSTRGTRIVRTQGTVEVYETSLYSNDRQSIGRIVCTGVWKPQRRHNAPPRAWNRDVVSPASVKFNQRGKLAHKICIARIRRVRHAATIELRQLGRHLGIVMIGNHCSLRRVRRQ